MRSRLSERLFGGLDRVLADDRHDTRGRKVKPPRGPQIALVAVVVLLIASCLAAPSLLTAFNNRPAAVAYRAKGIAVIRGEFARLPACAACTQFGEDVTNAPGQPMRVVTHYHLPLLGCDSLGDYYQPLLAAAHWQVGASTATKTVGEYHLRYSFVCGQYDTYAVTIETEGPQFL